jgi:hypothetical protein
VASEEKSAAEGYLRDLGYIRKEWALEAKTTANDPNLSRDEARFEEGRLMAFCECLSLMEHQSDVFGLPRKAIGLDGFDAEWDLLGVRRNDSQENTP